MASDHEHESDFHRIVREHALQEALRELIDTAPPEPLDERFLRALARARRLLETKC
jgi:hypothetical protein